jgi:membrane protein implicated in regulation of membrane protease activity
MMTEIAALVVAALCLGGAMLIRHQGWLMAAVILYAAQIAWIVQVNLDLLLPALAIAITLATIAVSATMHRELASQDDTECHTMRKLTANRRRFADNIGS